MIQLATFACGCFWGVEATFRKLPGVMDVVVGYAGGKTANPTYRQVCTDTTGHAEVVQVSFDPAVISYETLLDTFWAHHDPTTLNRQGPDHGSQYRSAIFWHTAQQQEAAQRSKQHLQETKRFPRPIVTQIEQAQTFYPAEDFHQRYLEKQGGGSCHT